jgi:hypothetical protein
LLNLEWALQSAFTHVASLRGSTQGLVPGLVGRRILATIVLSTSLSVSGVAADSITGAVRNQSQGKPAIGDEVILLRLDQGMQEETRTKTDAQGAFTLPQTANAAYVVRVLHQGVNYDQRVAGIAPLQINVFDSVPKIPGMTGSIGMAQVESAGKFLKVTEMYAISNVSSPPVTQAGPRNFTISVPEAASLESVQVKTPGGIWTNAPTTKDSGQKNQYAVNFPLRPGDTLFEFIYRLPYTGPTTLHLRVPYPIKRFAVMHPPSMSFKALHPNTFLIPGQANGLQIEAAVAQPLAGDVPAFVISGMGSAPPAGFTAKAAPPVAAALPGSAVPSATNPAPQAPATSEASGPTAAPLASAPSAFEWRLLAVAGLLALGACGFLTWRARRRSRPGIEMKTKTAEAKTRPAAPSTTSLLEALKEELLALETNRLRGSISREEYDAAKRTLERTVKHALARAAAGR